MVSMEKDKPPQATYTACKSPDRDHICSPRISFSCDIDEDAISINLSPIKTEEKQNISNFEFLSDNKTQSEMPSADELFFEGKLLPYWQTHQSEKHKSVKLNNKEIDVEMTAVVEEEAVDTNADDVKEAESRVRTWFIDDDPSPRPPNCSVLWKELLKLKSREKAYTLSPSSSSSSSSSLDMSKEETEKEKNVKRVKKGLERTRSASLRIRPMVNVPICTPQSGKHSTMTPMFPMRRSGR